MLIVSREYKKKPVVITATQLTRENIDGVLHMFSQTHKLSKVFLTAETFDDLALNESTHEQTGQAALLIHTLEGNMLAKPGDYIIKGVQGELYPCKPDIFESTYEECGLVAGE